MRISASSAAGRGSGTSRSSMCLGPTVTAARMVAVFSHPMTTVHRLGLFEAETQVTLEPDADPLRDVQVHAVVTDPSGAHRTVPAFWDGGTTYRFRLSPGIEGEWKYFWSV